MLLLLYDGGGLCRFCTMAVGCVDANDRWREWIRRQRSERSREMCRCVSVAFDFVLGCRSNGLPTLTFCVQNGPALSCFSGLLVLRAMQRRIWYQARLCEARRRVGQRSSTGPIQSIPGKTRMMQRFFVWLQEGREGEQGLRQSGRSTVLQSSSSGERERMVMRWIAMVSSLLGSLSL